MPSKSSSARERLFVLLDKIIGEERSFRASAKDYQLQGKTSVSRFMSRNVDKAGYPEKYRRIFEELHRVHRQFSSDHELMIQRCLAIARQVRADLLTEAEIDLELDRLQSDLKRLKDEHQQAASESRRLLKSLRQLHGSSGGVN